VDSDRFTYVPPTAIDAGGRLVAQLTNGPLRQLARNAADLSVEAQQYLVLVANRLRIDEGLPLHEGER
jgi:hypothetical protein